MLFLVGNITAYEKLDKNFPERTAFVRNVDLIMIILSRELCTKGAGEREIKFRAVFADTWQPVLEAHPV